MTPSLPARLIGFILRTTGIYRRMFAGGPGFAAQLAKVRAAPLAAPDAKLRARIEVRETRFEDCPVWELAPRDRAPIAQLLYFHGGGYVYPALKGHWDFLGHLVTQHGFAITAPLYPLAPEHDALTTTRFAHALWNDFAARTPTDVPRLIGGDSAGGGLAAVTAMAARDAGGAQPDRLILICPWLNAVPDHPDQAVIEARDAILTRRGIAEAGALYARDLAPADPRVSPIHGDWQNLPPMLMFGGGDDLLVTDARALKALLPQTQYHEVAGMIHDWPIFSFRESRAAQSQMAAFAKG